MVVLERMKRLLAARAQQGDFSVETITEHHYRRSHYTLHRVQTS
jgi:hypothetical protein